MAFMSLVSFKAGGEGNKAGKRDSAGEVIWSQVSRECVCVGGGVGQLIGHFCTLKLNSSHLQSNIGTSQSSPLATDIFGRLAS